MNSMTFTLPEEKNIELYRQLLNIYGMKRAKTNEENENEIILSYPNGIFGDVELQAYISKRKQSPKVIIIGEDSAINHTKLNLEILVGEKLLPQL